MADPSRRRETDEVLFAAGDGSPAVVACIHSGSSRKVSKTKTSYIGPTVYWLTDPMVNNIVARFERLGAVKALEIAMKENNEMMRRHLASHSLYVDSVLPRLSDEQREFFMNEYVNPSQVPMPARNQPFVSGDKNDEAVNGGEKMKENEDGVEAAPVKMKQPRPPKFGNGGVGEKESIKCCHALVAESLAGIPNPVGCSIIRYIVHLAAKVDAATTAMETEVVDTEAKKDADAATAGPSSSTATDAAPAPGSAVSDQASKQKAPRGPNAIVDDLAALVEFCTTEVNWSFDGFDLQGSGVCECAKRVLVFAEGHVPKCKKKHRIN